MEQEKKQQIYNSDFRPFVNADYCNKEKSKKQEKALP